MHSRLPWTALAAAGFLCAAAAEFRVPGVNYTAQIREDLSILPGGRALRPFGRRVMTGTAPFAIGVSPSGKTIVTANIGISTAIGVNRPSITVITPGKRDSAWNLSDLAADPRQSHSQAWQGLTAGVAITGDNSAWVPEGDSGRVVELNLSSGSRKNSINLNAEDYKGSFTGPLVYENERYLLIALDQANDRAAIIDLKRSTILASVKTSGHPVALALAAGGKRLYIATASSLSIIDLANPLAPRITSEVPLLGEHTPSAPFSPSPAGIAVNGDEVYISLSHEDAVCVIDGKAGKLTGEIALRIPGLESLRGITPLGLAFDAKSGRLLVAEAGLNAVGVIDPASRKLLGHLPVGWFPNSICVRDGQVYVAASRGVGTGPSSPAQHVRMLGGSKPLVFETDTAVLRRGSVSAFAIPAENELAHQTEIALQANGFTQIASVVPPKSVSAVRNVVLILKGNRSFDEVLGDIERAGDKAVLAAPAFARFGSDGYVSGDKQRFSLHVNVTPNHHEIAQRWSFADNFYSDSETSAAGFRWLMGCPPDFGSETSRLYREAGNRGPFPASEELVNTGLLDHLQRHDIAFRFFGEEKPADAHMTDAQRADEFIAAIRKDYLETGKPLPRFLLLNLPDDAADAECPGKAYPYDASCVAANDFALGRILEFLSLTPWWKEMAVFAAGTGAEAGADHIDSHRTLLLGAGPWFRSAYVSHTNSSAPALLRTVFKLLDLPPMNLYDATAGDLLDMLGAVPDFTPFQVKAEDPRLFDIHPVK